MDTHKPGHPLHAETIMSVKALQDELAHIDKQISKYQQAKKNVEARIKILTAGNSNKESLLLKKDLVKLVLFWVDLSTNF